MATVQQLIEATNKAAKKTIGAMGLEISDSPRLPTGIFALDLAMGGGFPQGRAGVIYGFESAMKTTLSLKLIANAQRILPKKRAVYFDLEGSLDQEWAENFGVSWKDLLVVRPEHAEQCVDMYVAMMLADDVSVLVLDSIAAMVTTTELEKSAEQANVGTQGLLINKLYRKSTNALTEAQRAGSLPTPIFINQIRYKVGVMYGSNETVPGGPSINQFLSSMTLRVRGEDIYLKKGNPLPAYKKIHVTIRKWKVPILSKNCEYSIALRDLPEIPLKLGDSPSWNTVLIYLKKLGLLLQVKDGWELQALVAGVKMVYPTQDALAARYLSEQPFADKMRKAVIDKALGDGLEIEDAKDE